MKALIYCRVSTEEQAGDDRHSLRTQLKLCQRAIDEGEKYKLANEGIYQDAGKSATTMNRPGLQDLLVRVKEDKQIKAVYVQDTDRLARNVQDHLTIKSLLKQDGVELVSVSQSGLDDSPEGNFSDLVIAGVNQLQSQITARKTIKNLEEKFNGGWWPSLAPIGYKNVGNPKDDNQRIIGIDEERAPLITEAFKLYVTGHYSIMQVRDMMYKRGLVSRAGKMIALSKFNAILKCPFYHGEMRWRGLVRIGNHEPIIDEEIFKRCQTILSEHIHHATRNRKHNFLLRGFTFCGKCGQRYTAEHHWKKNISYYHCNRAGDQIKCSDNYVEIKELEKQIEQKFREIQFSEDMINKIVTKIKVIYVSKKTTVSHQKKNYSKTKLNLEKKLEVAEEKLISGLLADETYTKIKNRLRERIENLEDEIFALDRSKNLKMDVIQEVLNLIRNIGATYKKASPELKRLYLGLFWDKFIVAEKIVQQAEKSPIVSSLEAIGALRFNSKRKTTREGSLAKREVILTSGWGA